LCSAGSRATGRMQFHIKSKSNILPKLGKNMTTTMEIRRGEGEEGGPWDEGGGASFVGKKQQKGGGQGERVSYPTYNFYWCEGWKLKSLDRGEAQRSDEAELGRGDESGERIRRCKSVR